MKISRGLSIGAVLAVLSASGCQQSIDWVHDLENGDYSKVRFERAPSGMQPFALSGDDETYMAMVQNYFAEHQPLLNTLAAQCPCVEPSSLDDFKLQGVLSDTLGGRLLVQFFARYEHPTIFGGRRVQFLLSSERQLEAIYVNDSPLEH